MAGEKISGYTADATSDPIKVDDYLDFSNSPDFGATWNLSKKIKVSEFTTYLKTVIDTLYSADGTVLTGRTVSITDTLTFGTSLFQIDETDDKINIGFGLLLADKTNGTINVKGAIDNNVRFTLRGIGSDDTTKALLVESQVSEVFSARDGGLVNSRDGYWLDETLFVHATGATTNTFVGQLSGTNAIASSSNNTGINNSLTALTNGDFNVAIGMALNAITTEVNNVAVGVTIMNSLQGNSNVHVGNDSWTGLLTGDGNIGLGANIGSGFTGGSNNILIGRNSFALVAGSYNNSIALGQWATIHASNTMVIGDEAAKINDIYLGRGVDQTAMAVGEITLHSTSVRAGELNEATVHHLVLAPGASSGNIVGANLRVDVAPAGASGTAQNSYITAMTIQGDGLVAIGDQVATSKLHIEQGDTTGALPVMTLDQTDVSEEYIEFLGTIGTGNSIEAVAAKTLTTTHFLKVKLQGGLIRYIPAGTIA